MLKTLADIQQIEQAPLSTHNLPLNTYELVKRGADINPRGDALIFFLQGTHYKVSVHCDYTQFLKEITSTANLFHGLGISSRDTISILLPNLPEMWFALLGAEAVGIVNPINPMLEPEIIAEIMRTAESKILVTLAPFPGTDLWQKAEKIQSLVPSLKYIVTVDMGRYLSGLQKLGVGLMRLGTGLARSAERIHVIDFHREQEKYNGLTLQTNRVIHGDDIASYFHTGGTTGIPRLACRSHANEVFSAWVLTQVIPASPNRSILNALPLFHVTGFTVNGMHPFLMGNTVIMATPQGFRGKGVMRNFWKIIEHYRTDFISAVPTVYTMLLQNPVDADVSSLQFALCGSAPMPVNIFRTFEKRFHVRLLEGYGLTEGTCICATNPPDGERRVGSVGFRLPYQQMRVVHLDEAGQYVRDAMPDEVGVVIISGPQVFQGYKQDQHNRDIWLDIAGERWLNTGDMGRQDSDGYFWLVGRKKDLIIRGGHNIDPAMIEEPLINHPAVAFAAAVGRPDARLGEVPTAYVELKPGQAITEQDLLAYLSAHIGERAATPRCIKIIDHMPMTMIGKIYKPDLRGREASEVYQTEVNALGIGHVTTHAVQTCQGMHIVITLTALPGCNPEDVTERITRALGAYTIPHDLRII